MEDFDERSVTLRTAPDWRGLAMGMPISIGADPRVNKLLESNATPGGRPRLRLAGPIQVHSDRNGVIRVLPVFLVSVVATRQGGALTLKAEVPARVNEAWLDSLFPRSRADLRENLLVNLGIYDERFVDDGVEVVRGADRTVEELWWALAGLSQGRFVESGGPDRLQVRPELSTRSESGLYHRAVLLAGSDSSFTAGNLAELRTLAKARDEDLEGTALGAFFAPLESPVVQGRNDAPRHALPEFQPLNPEQHEVVRSAFTAPVLAVQGPPGTGKSTVVTHVLTAHALAGNSALFASKNHRALEAVVPRLRAIDEDRPLILRLTKSLANPDEKGDDWLQSLLELIARPGDPDELGRAVGREATLSDALYVREQSESNLRREVEHAASLADANTRRAELEDFLGPAWSRLAADNKVDLPVARLERSTQRIAEATSGPLSRIRAVFARRFVRRILRRFTAGAEISEVWGAPSDTDVLSIANSLIAASALGSCAQEIAALENEARGLPSREDLVNALETADEEVRATTRLALQGLAASLGARMDPEDRSRLLNIRGELGGRRRANAIHRLRPELRVAVERAFESAVQTFPLWACSNLSVRSKLPLVPAVFDLVVIDEASQCDIPSCLPLLYRAKRSMIVGDPMQLRHIGKVGQEVEDRIRERNDLDSVEFGRFRYSANSIWEPAFAASHHSRGASHMLKEHWRCHPAIADYFSTLFYDGKLRIRTMEEKSPPVVRGERRLRGIEWTHVPGGSETTPGGSRFWGPQIEAIVAELVRVQESGYEGTVGVVTPFRAHADRINDEASRRIARSVLKKWSFASETADGFQGDERDLVIFGLVGGPGAGDTPGFYGSNLNRFNVAVSRARSLLHVFGDQEWAASSGMRVLTELVEAWRNFQRSAESPVREELIGPVWEPRLAGALTDAGIDYFQQYRACGFFLDFALIRDGLRIDVEVDGETYHRGPDGGRKVEDIRRDQILKSAGWHVLRFWVYELREDLGKCIERIRTVLRASSDDETGSHEA